MFFTTFFVHACMLLQSLVALFAQNFALQATAFANVPSMSQIVKHFLHRKTDSHAHNLTRPNRPPGSFEHVQLHLHVRILHTSHFGVLCCLAFCKKQQLALVQSLRNWTVEQKHQESHCYLMQTSLSITARNKSASAMCFGHRFHCRLCVKHEENAGLFRLKNLKNAHHFPWQRFNRVRSLALDSRLCHGVLPSLARLLP